MVADRLSLASSLGRCRPSLETPTGPRESLKRAGLVRRELRKPQKLKKWCEWFTVKTQQLTLLDERKSFDACQKDESNEPQE
jgi:hypothetical protein